MSEEQKQSWNLLKPGSFDICKNATIPMIVMLDHSEIDLKVSSTGMKTAESDNYREVLEDDRDTNSIVISLSS